MTTSLPRPVRSALITVATATGFGVKRDQLNRVTFTPVTTTALRLEVQLQPKFSGGILEWRMKE
ncbi:MAG: hypothetical protein NT105_10620 [Verrucomicrobia bacterium]|nr:hypothetical protein [Verrucomicrobiota bacterium]